MLMVVIEFFRFRMVDSVVFSMMLVMLVVLLWLMGVVWLMWMFRCRLWWISSMLFGVVVLFW